ncbi:MAG: formate dehydrogenase accessory sulfurtransferase FdhD [Phycisphaerae bacterium]|nr:formate dehydrogenase accessory sulfurtransferase FdhD [Phycisphaerae bacterium]
MPTPSTTSDRVWRVTQDGAAIRDEVVAIEEPLAIRIDGVVASVTMRTPGADRELAIGFLRAERVISSADDVVHAAADTGADGVDAIDVRLGDSARSRFVTSRRATIASTSCGLCGVVDINRLIADVPLVERSGGDSRLVVAASTLLNLPDAMRREQAAFERTGGLHAAALVDLGVAGGADAERAIEVCREDVGRHNAVDKVIGWATLRRVGWLGRSALVVSGRTSFEIVQKSAVAGVPIVVAVSAPSSLAIDCARRAGITLVGFVRAGAMNVYSGFERLEGKGG